MVTKEHLEKAKELMGNLFPNDEVAYYSGITFKDTELIAKALAEAEEKGRQKKVKELISPFIKGTFNNKLQEMKK